MSGLEKDILRTLIEGDVYRNEVNSRRILHATGQDEMDKHRAEKDVDMSKHFNGGTTLAQPNN